MPIRPTGIAQRCLPTCPTRCKQHTWGYRITVRREDGTRTFIKEQGFPTMAAAVAARQERLNEPDVAARPAVPPTPSPAAPAVAAAPAPRFTVAEALDAWLSRGHRNRKWKPSTEFGYRRYVDVDLKPALGHLDVLELRHTHVEEFYGRLFTREPKPLTGASLRRIHACLTAAWKDVLRDERVVVDYVSRVELPKSTPKAANPWTLEEWRTFARSEDGSRLWPLWVFMVETGMRRGELVGLRWRDLDLDAGLLRVRTSIWENKHVRHEGTPKSAAGTHRPVPLSAALVVVLRAWRETQAREHDRMLAAGYAAASESRAEGWVWTHGSGTVWKGDEMYARFKRAQRKAGVRHVRLHDQRHLSATLGRVVGEDPLATRGRLGHSSAAMTEHYTHLAPDHEAADARSRLLMWLAAPPAGAAPELPAWAAPPDC